MGSSGRGLDLSRRHTAGSQRLVGPTRVQRCGGFCSLGCTDLPNPTAADSASGFTPEPQSILYYVHRVLRSKTNTRNNLNKRGLDNKAPSAPEVQFGAFHWCIFVHAALNYVISYGFFRFFQMSSDVLKPVCLWQSSRIRFSTRGSASLSKRNNIAHSRRCWSSHFQLVS